MFTSKEFTTILRTSRHTGLLWLAGLAAVCAWGCGDGQQFKTAPVSGTVTLDGKPVTSGSVIFTPMQGWPAQGDLNDEGRFILTTYSDGDGAIVGEHRVAIIAQTGDDPSQHFERPPSKPVISLVPDRYANKATSGITFEVSADKSNQAQLQLVSKAPRR